MSEPIKSPQERAWEHLGLIASFLVGGFVLARIWAASGYSQSTALVILNTQSTTSVVLGSLLPFVATAVTLLFSAGMVTKGGNLARPRTTGELLRYTLYFFLVAGFASAITPTAILAIVMAGPVVVLGIWAWHSPRETKKRSPIGEQATTPKGLKNLQFISTALRVNLLVQVAFLAIVALVSPPWLPREVVQVGNHRPVDGYVLSVESDSVIVLEHSPRGVVRLSGTVTERGYCTANSSGQKLLFRILTIPVWGLWADVTRYPECKELAKTMDK